MCVVCVRVCVVCVRVCVVSVCLVCVGSYDETKLLFFLISLSQCGGAVRGCGYGAVVSFKPAVFGDGSSGTATISSSRDPEFEPSD